MSYGSHDRFEMSLAEVAEELYRRGLTDRLYSKAAVHMIEKMALKKLKAYTEGKAMPTYNPAKLPTRAGTIQVEFADGTMTKIYKSKLALSKELNIPYCTINAIEDGRIGKTEASRYYGWKIHRH